MRLLDAGHAIVGVYAPPAANRLVGGKPDPLAEEAEQRGLRTFRYKAFRRQGQAIPERVAEYAALGAELNVMPYTTVILPPEIVTAPPLGSLCFHPSLLPAFRGGAAIPWQIILGERETGVTVFVPDAGVDTGPIVVQSGGVAIDGRRHRGEPLLRQALSARRRRDGSKRSKRSIAAPPRHAPQDESRASFQGLVTDDVARIDWERPAAEIDRLVARLRSRIPGARHCAASGERVRLLDARLAARRAVRGAARHGARCRGRTPPHRGARRSRRRSESCGWARAPRSLRRAAGVEGGERLR